MWLLTLELATLQTLDQVQKMTEMSLQVASATFLHFQAVQTFSVTQEQPLLPPWDKKTRTYSLTVTFNHSKGYKKYMVQIKFLYLHVGNMNHISILVFGLHNHSSRPSTANVIFVQDQRCLLGVCIRVWLQPSGLKDKKVTKAHW